MSKRTILAKNLKVNDIVMLQNNVNRMVKYVNVGPKLVYVKSLEGKALSFPVDDRLVVVSAV